MAAFTAVQLRLWKPDTIAALRADPEASQKLKNYFTQPIKYMAYDAFYAIKVTSLS